MSKKLLFTLLAAALMTFSALAAAGLNSMRGPLFEATDAVRAEAEAREAPLLAPVSWAEGQSYYERADSSFKRAGNLDGIRRNLDKARLKFQAASEQAVMAAAALDVAIQARKDAMAAEAQSFAADSWREGEAYFAQATERLERSSIRYAQRYAAKAEAAYREGELAAIKANYLSETAALIKQAEKLRATRYAPMSLNNARILLDTAETELTANRYDTDRPRQLALDAKHNARHAIYVSGLEKSLRERSTNLEAILLDWERSMAQLGAALDRPLYFDEGEKAAVQTLLEGINELKAEKASLAQDLADKDSQVAALTTQIETMQTVIAEVNALQEEKAQLDANLGDKEAQVALMSERLAKMQELLGGGNQTIEELETLLEQQARHRERFARVETLFAPGQAEVFRNGDTVFIRMVGLNFDSGADTLKAEHRELLTVLEAAIAEFPESHVMVEGHTDAFGSDDQNLALSEARAQSVVRHLLASMPISPLNLEAIGYGESRPVANNETEDGRRRNRRIDVVIEPSWVTREQAVAQIDVDARVDELRDINSP